MTIENIVFDIGNVLVRWDPAPAIFSIMPELDLHAFKEGSKEMSRELSVGAITEEDAAIKYSDSLNLSQAEMMLIFEVLKTHQNPIEGSFELLKELKDSGYRVFSITDNTNEGIEYYREHADIYPFINEFEGIISSSDADIATCKPDPKIYNALFSKYDLRAEDSLFLDDLLSNITGARAIGMHGIQFFNPAQCRSALSTLGVKVSL